MPKEQHVPRVVDECERIANEFGRSKALEGLRQAANDMIEQASGYSLEAVKIIDDALRNAGLVTLSEIRRRYAASYKKILRRGAINTETEYYLVHGIVVDLGSDIADEERSKLRAMALRFEEDLSLKGS